jgi:hypothetical protein
LYFNIRAVPFQHTAAGADPGFQVRGGVHLKKLRRAEGGANFLGIHIKFSMTGQEKGGLLIEVKSWAGLTVNTVVSLLLYPSLQRPPPILVILL